MVDESDDGAVEEGENAEREREASKMDGKVNPPPSETEGEDWI